MPEALDVAAPIFRKLGAKKLAPQPVAHWNGPGELPAAVAEFYARIGPLNLTLQGPGNAYFFPALRDLARYQRLAKESAGWSADWLALAHEGEGRSEEGSDPFIFSRKTGEILFAFSGGETWVPEKVFESLPQMALTVAVACDYLRRNFGKGADNYIHLNPGQEDELLVIIGPFFGSREAALEALRRLGISM